MEEKLKIFFCEDDENLGMLLREYLQAKGYVTDLFSDGEAGYKGFTKGKYDLCVLDVMMPKKDGFTLAQEIRSINPDIPVIFLTAKTMKEDILEGFKIGADDYLTKPFSVEELLARLRVTQRRLSLMTAEMFTASSVFVNGKLKVDYAGGCAYLDENELHLTPIEYKLLCLLSKNVGKVLTHTFITQNIWGRSWDNDVASLRVFMATLRKKLEPTEESPQYIQTHIGVGYRMIKVE